MQRRRVGAAVDRADLDQDIIRRSFGVFHENIEIAIFIKDAGVEQLVFQLLPRPLAAGISDLLVGEIPLRVLVKILHIRMGWGAVQVEVVLLDVLAVIAFGIGQPEQALLQDRINAVPQRQ